MSRRTGWLIAVGIIVLALIGGAVWLWQARDDAPAVPSETPAAASTPEPTGDTLTLVQDELDAQLLSCTKEETVGGAAPDDCGIRIPWGTEFTAVESMTFRIEQLPAAELTTTGDEIDGFIATGGVLVATITGTGPDGTPRTETYRTETWEVRGDVSLSDDRVAITVW